MPLPPTNLSSLALTHQSSPVSLGVIEFINTIPIYFGLQTDPLAITRVVANPAQLNERMTQGLLDVSPVSSAHYLRHKDRYVLLDDLSVSSYGSVDSVLFLTQMPFERWLQQTTPSPIAVPNDSETSIALLGHLLQQESGLDYRPQMVVYEASQYQEALQQYGAVLIIGDRALSSQQQLPTASYYCTDLAQWWVSQTQLPFVFAVWVAQKPWSQKHPDTLKQLNQQLVTAKTRFFQSPELLAAAIQLAQQETGLPADLIHRYWHQSLNYDLTSDHHRALQHFENIVTSNTITEASVLLRQQALSV